MRILKAICAIHLFLYSSIALCNSDKLDEKIKEFEELFRLPSNLLAAIVKVEIDFNPKAISPTAPASYGLAQITKDAAWYRCGIFMRDVKVLLSPVTNLNCAARILQEDLKVYKDVKLVIAAYNAGTACVCNGSKYLNAHDGNLCNVRKTSPILCQHKGSILNRGYVQKVEDARNKLGLIN